MMRLAAGMLIVGLGVVPLAMWPGVPVTWLVVLALLVGGVGVVALSVPLVTVSASLALIAYTLALTITRMPVDPFTAIVVGVTMVLLLALVHFASGAEGATIGRAVITSQLRRWLLIVGAGAMAALALTVVAVGLAPIVTGGVLPVAIVIAALGALVAAAGVIALLTREAS
jgi:hypothetical protein